MRICLSILLIISTTSPLANFNSGPARKPTIVAVSDPEIVKKIIIPSAPKPVERKVPRVASRHRSVTVSKPTLTQSSLWDRLAECEASGDWSANTGNGFYGGLQFTSGTWHSFGGTGSAQNASRAEQIRVAKNVLAGQGWGAWPTCSRKLGLR